jgi:hypothetical protein
MAQFLRISDTTIVNVDHIKEVTILRSRDEKPFELILRYDQDAHATIKGAGIERIWGWFNQRADQECME